MLPVNDDPTLRVQTKRRRNRLAITSMKVLLKSFAFDAHK